MTWLSPFAFLWGLVAVPVVALYLLRVRRRRVEVPTLQFWEEVVGDRAPRAWWQRIRHLFSLLLQLIFIALLVSALMDPLPPGESARPRLVVLVLDRSASMAMPVATGETRFERAVAEARGIIDGLREWDEAVLITADSVPRVETGRTTEPQVLREALRSFRCSSEAGGLREAIAAARGIDPGDRSRELVILTDSGGRRDAGEAAAGETWRVLGEPVANAGITAFASRPASRDRSRHDVLVQVGNFGPAPRELSLAVQLDDRLVDSLSFSLPPGTQQTARIRVPVPEGGRLTARIRPEGRGDGFPLDDMASLVIPAPRPRRVAWVAGRENLFLERALASVPLVEVARIDPDVAGGLGPETCDAVVFDHVVPSRMPRVDTLVLDPPGDGPGWTLGPMREEVLVTGRDEDDGLLAHTRWDRVRIRRARPIVSEDGHTLLSSFGASVLTAWDRDGYRHVVLSVDLSRTDLPLRTAFPILVANWLQPEPGASAALRSDARTGSPLDAAESNGWFEEEPSGTAGGDDGPFRAGTSPWRWLALAGLALFTVEWGLHQRRIVE